MVVWAGVQDLHGALLARMLRRQAMQPPSVADVAIDVRHACLTEAYDCFCAAVAATVSLTSSASASVIHLLQVSSFYPEPGSAFGQLADPSSG